MLVTRYGDVRNMGNKGAQNKIFGHVEKMNRIRMPKISKRRKGRPRKRWVDSVQEDLEKTGISNWKEKAADRGEWKKITRVPTHTEILIFRNML